MHKVGAVRIAYDNKRLSDVGTEGLRGGSEMVGVIMPLGRKMPLGDGVGRGLTSWGLTAAGIGDRGVESTCQGHHTW